MRQYSTIIYNMAHLILYELLTHLLFFLHAAIAEFVFWSRSDSDRKPSGVSGAVCIKPRIANSIANTTWLCNGFPSLVSAWLRMTFVFYVLNMTASHSQNWYSGPWQSSRFQPTGRRQVPSPSERCKQSGSTIAKTLLAAWMSTLTRAGTWLCNGFASLVLEWLGDRICNVSCYTYMNISNGCHSAKTTGQLPVTNGFTMIADGGMTLSSGL